MTGACCENKRENNSRMREKAHILLDRLLDEAEKQPRYGATGVLVLQRGTQFYAVRQCVEEEQR